MKNNNNTIKDNSNVFGNIKHSNQNLVDSALELHNEINSSYWDLDNIRRIFIKTYIYDCFAKDNPNKCDTGSISAEPILKKRRKFIY